MDSRILPPIPTPPAQRWREVRLVYLPRLLFAAGVALIVWLWNDAVAPSSLVAEAEIVGSDLRTSKAGVIASLKVALHQPVRSGEIVGYIAAANPRLLDATLAVIRAEVGMLGDTMAGATDRQRAALEFERMEVDWMKSRVDRAALQMRLQQAEADLSRGEPLFRAGLMTEGDYAQLKITRDGLAAQIDEQNKLVGRLEPILRGLAVDAAAMSGQSALAAAIKVQDAKLKLAEEQLAPVPLIAPIDGVVVLLLRHAGETVTAGDTVLRVAAVKPDRLAGFLRQPLPFEPKRGMAAEIRTRGIVPKKAATTITEVGTVLETISPTMLAAMRLPSAPAPETGLRVEFALPSGLQLRPGEHVDVFVH